MKTDNTPENVKKLRLKTGLTQKECSHIYGVGLRPGRKKRKSILKTAKDSRRLSFLSYLQRNILNTCYARGDNSMRFTPCTPFRACGV